MLLSPRTREFIEALNRKNEELNSSPSSGSARNIEGQHERSIGSNHLGTERRHNTASEAWPVSQNPKTESRLMSMRERLVRVCDAWDDFQESRSRDAIYPYLKAVFSLVGHYERRGRVRRLLRRATAFAGLEFERDADPFATIIRSTSERSCDTKTTSKLARALRYCAYRKRAPRQLMAFIKAHGGINACADLYAKWLGRGSRLD